MVQCHARRGKTVTSAGSSSPESLNQTRRRCPGTQTQSLGAGTILRVLITRKKKVSIFKIFYLYEIMDVHETYCGHHFMMIKSNDVGCIP